MDKLTSFVEEKIAPPLIKFSQMRYVQVMQRTGLGIMGLLVIGSLFLLLASFPYDPYLELLGDFRWTLAAASGVGTAFIGIFTVITTSYGLAEWYNKNKGENIDLIQPVVLSTASFMLINPAETVETFIEGADPGVFEGVPTEYLGPMGVFTALIVGIVSIEIYRFFVNRNITIKLPENVPSMVSQAFVSLIPSTVVVVFWWVLGHVIGVHIPELIQAGFEPLIAVGDTPWAVILASFLNRVLWSVGIHGGNIVNSVGGTFWGQMTAANQDAFQQTGEVIHTYTSVYMDKTTFGQDYSQWLL